MVLNLDEEQIQFEQVDVRETAIEEQIASSYKESTGAQNLTNANGFTDLTGVSISVTLKESKDIVIFGNVEGILPSGEDLIGCSIRILIDGSAQANSVRTHKIEMLEVGGNAEVRTKDDTDTIFNVATQFHVQKAAATYTIKLQAKGFNNGTPGWAVQMASGKSSLLVMVV